MRPAWSPEGARIAWVSSEDSTSVIKVKRADGVGPTSTPSLDGRYIACVSGESGKDEIYVRPFPKSDDGSFVREGNSRTYDVTPDGRFVMLRGGPTTLGAPVLVENWVADLRRKLKK